MELLRNCRDHAYKFYSELLIAAEKTLNEALFEQAEACSNSDEQRQYYDAMQMLREHGSKLQDHFVEGLHSGYEQFTTGEYSPPGHDLKLNGGELSLMQRDELEDELAISVIVSKANSRNSEALWKLNRRLAVVRGGKTVTDEDNPFGPAKVCTALQHGISQLNLDNKAKIFVYKHIGKVFIVSFNKELETLNKLLADRGILPNIRFTLNKQNETANAPSNSGSPDAEDALSGNADPMQESQSAIANQQQLYAAIRALQSDAGPRLSTAGGVSFGAIKTDGSGGAESFSPIDYVRALSFVHQSKDVLAAIQQGQALSIDQAEQQFVAQLSQVADGQEAGSMTRDDADTVDLVGMIFRYMLDDPNLHDAVKSLLSHLHTPYLKLALIDKSFLTNYQHSARLLLNTMAEVGTRWVKEHNDRNVLPKIKTVVEHILKGFVDDITVFDRLLEDFARFKDNLQKRANMVERRNTEAQQGQERLELARQQADDELEERLTHADIPKLAADLLRRPWADFLAYNLLRHGEESLTWQSALKVLEGVIWSVSPEQIANSMDDLQRRQIIIEQTVSEGLSTIGYDPEASKTLINALKEAQELVFRGAQNSQHTTEQDDAVPADAFADTLSKAQQAAPLPASNGDSSTDTQASKPIATADSVKTSAPGPNTSPKRPPRRPAAERAPLLSPAEQEMLEQLQEIAFGTWFEFNRDGRKQQLKLAWFSRVSAHYMFVDHTGVKQAVEKQHELAKAMCKGTVKLVTKDKPSFMERALGSVLDRLKLGRSPAASA